MNELNLRDIDREILQVIDKLNRSNPAEISNYTETSTDYKYVFSRIKYLNDLGLLTTQGKGIYELSKNGRNKVKEIKEKDRSFIEKVKRKMKENSVMAGAVGPGEDDEEKLYHVWIHEKQAKKELEELGEKVDIEDYEILTEIRKELNKASLTNKFKEKLKIR